MKRLIVVATAFLIVGFAIGRVSTQLTVNAEGRGAEERGAEEPCSETSSDSNGDGSTDITDAVVTLNWLFRGGPAPVPLCQSTDGKGLPDTGLTKCYDRAGAETDCGSAEFPGQDGFYKSGCPNEGRFVDNGDGTVTDSCTGLMWQKKTADIDGNGSIGEEDAVDWQVALKYCEGLDFAGHDDWRLPSMRELLSLLDYGRFDVAIDPVFEAGTDALTYWSSSSNSCFSDHAWCVDFVCGYVLPDMASKSHGWSVRAVRGGA